MHVGVVDCVQDAMATRVANANMISVGFIRILFNFCKYDPDYVIVWCVFEYFLSSYLYSSVMHDILKTKNDAVCIGAKEIGSEFVS